MGDANRETTAVRVAVEALEDYLAALFSKTGLTGEDARFLASCIVQTSLWGKGSHGVMRVPHYVQRLESGAINPRPKTTIVRGGEAFEIMDGDNGPGFLVGRDAMLRAVTLARTHYIGAVGVVESTHFGAAALYARLAVDQGMVGIAMTNSVPKMVAPGGAKPVAGSNPIAIGVPTYAEFPFVLDLSLATVAGGRLLLAAANGEKIPSDWATDKQGRPTDDPAVAFAGYWLPLGGVKGLGLAYAVDILCGLITGGAFASQVKSQYADASQPSRTSHFMIALNVDAVMGRDELRDRMAAYIDMIKSSPLQEGAEELLVPGERSHRAARAAAADGLELQPALYEELCSLGAQHGLTGKLAPL